MQMPKNNLYVYFLSGMHANAKKLYLVDCGYYHCWFMQLHYVVCTCMLFLGTMIYIVCTMYVLIHLSVGNPTVL